MYDYTPDRGHLVMYENDQGEAQAQEHVPDFEVRNYILIKDPADAARGGERQEDGVADAPLVEVASIAETSSAAAAAAVVEDSEALPEKEDVVVLNNEEAELLKELQEMVVVDQEERE